VRTTIEAAPAFRATRAVLGPLLAAGCWPTLSELSQLTDMRCEQDQGVPRRRGERLRADLYDARIAQRGVLPTRPNNWHDLFNAVTWAAFPYAKRALHARQYRRLCERVPERFERLPGERTTEQSALTQVDEGGLLIALPEPRFSQAAELLTERLQQLSLARTPLTQAHLAPLGASARIFGHALHEHLALGARVPRAAVLLLPCASAELDTTLTEWLDDDSRPFRCAPATAWVTVDLDTSG
jgi:hypothetical protein